MNKAEALKMYESIIEAQGEHNGRWRDELDQEDSTEDYLSFMINACDELDIAYDTDLTPYIDNEDDLKYMAKDALGCDLKHLALSKLRNIILA